MARKKRVDAKGLTIREQIFCKEYAITGNGSWSTRVAWGGSGLTPTYMRNTLVNNLLKRRDIRDMVELFRLKFLEKYGADIGDEVMVRARGADDKEAYKYYQQAINMMGLEAPKKSESKQEKVVSFPVHEAPQIEADVTIEGDDGELEGEEKETPLLEAAVDGEADIDVKDDI